MGSPHVENPDMISFGLKPLHLLLAAVKALVWGGYAIDQSSWSPQQPVEVGVSKPCAFSAEWQLRMNIVLVSRWLA